MGNVVLDFLKDVAGGVLGEDSGDLTAADYIKLLGGLGGAYYGNQQGVFDPQIPDVGYQGEIPKYTAVQQAVTGRDDTQRRPGSAGRRYMSDVFYAKQPEGQEPMTVEQARAAAQQQATGLAAVAPPTGYNRDAAQVGMADPRQQVYMAGGRVLEDGGYLEGASDGQADKVAGDIDGVQEARLSHGEYVLPADLVALLGNGNSNAGAQALDQFMAQVRKKGTGTPKQQNNIDTDKVLAMLANKAG